MMELWYYQNKSMKYSYQTMFESAVVTSNKGCVGIEDNHLSNISITVDSLADFIFIYSMFLL